ncbi:hypothetical protein D9M68_572190 [compost metagenome]
MFYPRKNALISGVYYWYFRLIFRRNFAALEHQPFSISADESVLMLANHASWWDAFMLAYLNKKVFKKNFYMLISADEYCRRPYLKYFGAFAPAPGRKDTQELLKYAGQVLDNPANILLIFPQGEVKSGYVQRISFEKGLMQLINASEKNFQTVFSVILTDYFNASKPSAMVSFAVWEMEEYTSLQLLKSEYNKHYSQAILKQAQKAS